jgi:trans-aconitate methyltransferase
MVVGSETNMIASAWDARLYDDKHAFVWEKAKGVVELLAPRPGERILDLGCGTGHPTAEIAARGATVIGVDQSAAMIAEAKAKHPGIAFEVGDARELRFDPQFDAVFSNAALHWIREPEEVVRGVAKALKPGGRFVAEFGGKGNIQRLMTAIAGACAEFGIPLDGDTNPWYYPSIAGYAGLLETYGLEVRQAALFERPTRLEDGEKGLAAWLRMFATSFLNRVPQARQEAFLLEVERRARPELFRNGNWELDYRRLRIAAFKQGPAA